MRKPGDARRRRRDDDAEPELMRYGIAVPPTAASGAYLALGGAFGDGAFGGSDGGGGFDGGGGGGGGE